MEERMKTLLTAIGAALLAGHLWSQNPPDLPYSAKQVLDKMEAAVLAAKKKAIADLTAIKASETRSGKLLSATQLDAKIQDLSAEIEVLEGRPSDGKGTDFLPGKWRMGNGVLFVFEKDGAFAAEGGNFKWQGTWRVDGRKLLVDSKMFVDTYALPPTRDARGGKSGWSLKGVNSKGEPVYLDSLEK